MRLLALLAVASYTLFAHPMGNFSISHYAKLTPGADRLEVVYALDLAEIPTFELLRDWNLERTSPMAELEAKAREQMAAWAANLALSADGQPVPLRVKSAAVVISDGAGNLPVVRITGRLEAAIKPGRLTYEDRNYPDRAGWKEIVIAGGPQTVLERTSHTDRDTSKGLTAYPEDPTVAPPQDLRAELTWKTVAVVSQAPPPPAVVAPVEQPKPVMAAAPPTQSPAAAPVAPGTVQKNDALSRLLGRQELGFAAMLTALALAFGFGAMHALSPGHGKTIVAAYLVGSRGTLKHALFLGAMVTFTHTVSVFVLGLGTLFLSRYFVPDKIYPILGAVSGLTIVWIGATLFYKRLSRLVAHLEHEKAHRFHHQHSHEPAMAMAHGHSHGGHGHDHDHHHHDHDHDHGPGGHTHVIEGEVTLSSLTGLAVSGGLVPCPSALVLLLSSIAIGRIALGLALLTAFSLGLAVVLIGIGVAVLYAKNLLPDRPGFRTGPVFTMLPVVSAGVITVIGLVMTAAALGIVQAPWLQV
jgi:nickel/cobalt transporter (NicO) family protein